MLTSIVTSWSEARGMGTGFLVLLFIILVFPIPVALIAGLVGGVLRLSVDAGLESAASFYVMTALLLLIDVITSLFRQGS